MKKLNSKRLISGIIVAMLMVTMMVVPVSADETGATENLPVYQSSVGFVTDSLDGTWGTDSVWSAEEYNSNLNKYTQLTETRIDGDTTFWSNGSGVVYVDGTRLIPARGNTTDNAIYSAVKTFTAPKSGRVTITYGGSYIWDSTNNIAEAGLGKTAYNREYNYKITKQQQGTQNTSTVHTQVAADNSWEVEDVSVTLIVSQGDKLRFEASWAADAANNYGGLYCDPIITYTELIDDVADRDTFKSSEYFDTSNGDGTWDGGIWTAEVLDTTNNTYSAMTADTTNNSWSSDKQTITAAHINPPQGSATAIEGKEHLASVKTFKVPYSGKINISYATITDETALGDAASSNVVGLAKTKHNKQYSLKVRRRAASGESIALVTEYYTTDEADDQIFELTDPNTSIVVEKGQLLSFEVLFEETETSNWGGLLCDPIITYTELIDAPADRDTFKSSEYYDTTGEIGVWDSGVWKAKYYDYDATETERAKYKDMVTKKDQDGAVTWRSQPMVNDDYNYGDRAVWVGALRMKVELPKSKDAATENEKSGVIDRDYPVKMFTAPKAGVVSIGAETLAPETAGNAFNIRIMKLAADSGEPVKVWPTASDFYNGTAAVTDFEEIIIELAEGDMLTFESVYKYNSESANSPWSAAIDWDPVITYGDDILIDGDNITFKAGGTAVTDFAGIAAATSLTATVPVISNTAIESGVVIVAIYDDNGKLVRVATSEEAERSGITTSYSLTFSDAAASNIDAGSIKVFLWDSLALLNPLTEAVPYMTTE